MKTIEDLKKEFEGQTNHLLGDTFDDSLQLAIWEWFKNELVEKVPLDVALIKPKIVQKLVDRLNDYEKMLSDRKESFPVLIEMNVQTRMNELKECIKLIQED